MSSCGKYTSANPSGKKNNYDIFITFDTVKLAYKAETV